MFFIYLNELAEILASFGIKVKFFAYDVKVYVRIINDVDKLVLQEAIDALCNNVMLGKRLATMCFC